MPTRASAEVEKSREDIYRVTSNGLMPYIPKGSEVHCQKREICSNACRKLGGGFCIVQQLGQPARALWTERLPSEAFEAREYCAEVVHVAAD